MKIERKKQWKDKLNGTIANLMIHHSLIVIYLFILEETT